ncbi:hypothetical protein K7957_11040 [Sphingomonas yunnanensis]|uniref:hypothetical protein n=1 Tax=Sphingomonas yunnanensis TaxID=310400 RepID=UPI001CA7348F|nr:hypothetical protein [Sphingomonas yunnanensis]MBY9063465.1 hypothetical protein [Sphingomonas yunnanensis]
MRRAAAAWSRRSVLRGIGAGAATLPAAACAAPPDAQTVPDLAALRALDPRVGAARLTDPGRAGLFRWTVGDHRAQVARDPLGGRFVAARNVPASAGAWVRTGEVLTPEMFGADPGQADHSAVLEALFDQIAPGLRLRLDARYVLSRGLTVARKSGFVIEGRGSIVVKAGTPVAHGFWILYFNECSNFTLASLTVDGNRAARAPREVPAHTVNFQSCSHFECRGVRSINAVCDGFIVFSATPGRADTRCHHFRFVDCVTDNCYRQGCSVIDGHDGLFDGGSYGNTNGTAPSAGIDLESDAVAPNGAISGIVLHRVRFVGNHGYGLLVSPVARPENIATVDCSFENNRAGAISWGATSGRIANAVIRGFAATATRGAIDVPTGDGARSDAATAITSPRFERVTTTRAENPLVYVHSAAFTPVAITGLRAAACGAIAGLNRDGSSLVDAVVGASLGTNDGAISVSGRACTVARNRVARFFGSVVLVTGSDVVVRANMLSAPRFNDANGAIRILAAGATVQDNVIEGEGAVAIRLNEPARAADGNRIAGFARAIAVAAR